MAIKFYGYEGCSTCRKARKWLDERHCGHEFINITTQAPPAGLLRSILGQGRYKIKDLFNVTGRDYRAMGLKDKVAAMTEEEAIKLLASQGRLCKRPIISDGSRHTVGFVPEVLAQTWK